MKKNNIPKFKNESQERQFWSKHDLTEFIDQLEPVNLDLSKLKPSTKPITIRLPISLIFDLKKIANKHDIPYQSLMKVYLADKVKKEISSV